jgi:uncharacterized RDD family membrane protein YckC
MDPRTNPYSPPGASIHEVRGPREIVPAGRWPRFGSYLIDYIAFTVLATVGSIVVGRMTDDAGDSIMTFLVTLVAMLGYYAVLEGLTGRTLGKLLLGLKVVNEAGEPPSSGQILGRAFARLIPFEAFAIFGDERRTLHDSLAGTYVVANR